MHAKYKFILLLLIILLEGCDSNQQHYLIHDLIDEEQPDQICLDLTFSITDSNSTKTIIKSDTAKVFTNRNETVLTGNVEAIIYDKNGVVSGTLTAQQLIIDDKTKDMIATDNVIMISKKDGNRLETDELHWNQATRTISTNHYVTITSPTEIINGWGLESNENLSNYKIHKVTGVRQWKN